MKSSSPKKVVSEPIDSVELASCVISALRRRSNLGNSVAPQERLVAADKAISSRTVSLDKQNPTMHSVLEFDAIIREQRSVVMERKQERAKQTEIDFALRR